MQSLPYNTKKVDVGVTNLLCVVDICEVYHTKIQSFKGGRWRYKLEQCLKFAKSTIQRTRNSRVDVGVTNLQCPGNLQSRPYKDTRIQGWTLAIQTYSAN